MNADNTDRILLAHGGGGRLMQQLICRDILPKLNNDVLAELADSARLELSSRSVCFTTDSYTVKPLFFNGGDIGKLAVCGTINDLAVAGKTCALSLALIIEEGLEFKLLDKIIESVAIAAKQSDIPIVTGDTKVVETGAADKIFINTAGLGTKIAGIELSCDKISPGDRIIINGTIGDHGMAIMALREDIKFQSDLKSDCAPLAELTCKILSRTNGVRFMRDPTRGGLAATLNEIADSSGLSIEITEADIPVNPTVQAAADVLGFDVLEIANEGKFVAVVAADEADKVLRICRSHPLGKDANIIGTMADTTDSPTVELVTKIGGRRIVQMPDGRELPRIC